MGVPILNIVLGIPVGWCIIELASAKASQITPIIRRLFRYAAVTSFDE
jgi:hypothetical protein